ncbi:hypothetical protein OBBRIDRAFT_868424 [Obba rivulosa]|uniref:Uncharacterized protein n=1 Tax=Obba rivulosa TaxID=1052685 RepID=A0A8E2AKJ6_9APHY|nr:hypothetical protein OBBRIDRAFT_868424 [Obba rivulosa]
MRGDMADEDQSGAIMWRMLLDRRNVPVDPTSNLDGPVSADVTRALTGLVHHSMSVGKSSFIVVGRRDRMSGDAAFQAVICLLNFVLLQIQSFPATNCRVFQEYALLRGMCNGNQVFNRRGCFGVTVFSCTTTGQIAFRRSLGDYDAPNDCAMSSSGILLQ